MSTRDDPNVASQPRQALSGAVLTPRLVLTPVGRADVEDLTLLYGDPLVARWTGPWTRLTIEAWADEMAARWAEDGVAKWMARDRMDGSPRRTRWLHPDRSDGEVVLELGWAVRDTRTGRGYATEIGRSSLAWADEHHADLPTVAFTEVHNRASRAVMKRLGMRPSGTIRREGLIDGRTGLQPNAPFALYRR
jgi:RimJ/RimL family protein N-acetyltransferase